MSSLYGIHEAMSQANAMTSSVQNYNANARQVNEERGRDAKLATELKSGKYKAEHMKTEAMGGVEGLIGLSGLVGKLGPGGTLARQAKTLSGTGMSYFSPAGQAALTNVKIAQKQNWLSEKTKGSIQPAYEDELHPSVPEWARQGTTYDKMATAGSNAVGSLKSTLKTGPSKVLSAFHSQSEFGSMIPEDQANYVINQNKIGGIGKSVKGGDIVQPAGEDGSSAPEGATLPGGEVARQRVISDSLPATEDETGFLTGEGSGGDRVGFSTTESSGQFRGLGYGADGRELAIRGSMNDPVAPSDAIPEVDSFAPNEAFAQRNTEARTGGPGVEGVSADQQELAKAVGPIPDVKRSIPGVEGGAIQRYGAPPIPEYQSIGISSAGGQQFRTEQSLGEGGPVGGFSAGLFEEEGESGGVGSLAGTKRIFSDPTGSIGSEQGAKEATVTKGLKTAGVDASTASAVGDLAGKAIGLGAGVLSAGEDISQGKLAGDNMAEKIGNVGAIVGSALDVVGTVFAPAEALGALIGVASAGLQAGGNIEEAVKKKAPGVVKAQDMGEVQGRDLASEGLLASAPVSAGLKATPMGAGSF